MTSAASRGAVRAPITAETLTTAEREEVDVAHLATDALADAHAAGPDHEWHLTLLGVIRVRRA